jgi:hypothetical protein
MSNLSINEVNSAIMHQAGGGTIDCGGRHPVDARVRGQSRRPAALGFALRRKAC